MTTYFDREQSIEYRLGSETGPVLQTIANRFCADNPAVPVQYSLRSTQGFSITKDYLDEILLHEKFPQMEREQYVYARAGLTPQAPGPFHFRFGCIWPCDHLCKRKKIISDQSYPGALFRDAFRYLSRFKGGGK